MDHTKEEIQLSQDRRDRIINYLLEWLTGPDIDSKTFGHFRFIGEMFGITGKVAEMTKASSVEGRQELAISIALAALNLAVSDEPVEPSEGQIERRECRERAKQFEASLAGKSDAAGGVCVAEAVKPPSIHNRPRASLSPAQLERTRKSQRERQARWRAKVRAASQATAGEAP